MPNVTFLGAGSAVFARRLITDILHVDGLDEGIIALVDIDARRLDLTRQIAESRSGHRRSSRRHLRCTPRRTP